MRPRSSPALACIALAACGYSLPNAPVSFAQARTLCAGARSHVEVGDRGTVTRVLGVRPGRSAPHEGFWLKPPRGPAVLVEDNVALTGFIPLRTGDRVELQGQYECNDRVVHWTHRDPSGRHVSGFIIVGGRTYR